MGTGDFRKRDSLADFESCPTGFERRLHICLAWEIVAAKKVHADIHEDHLPERNLRSRVVGSVGGDGAVIFQQLDVGIDVGPESNFDDAAMAVVRRPETIGKELR